MLIVHWYKNLYCISLKLCYLLSTSLSVNLLSNAASDSIVEPQRSPLIPGMAAVIAASKKAGAYGCTISGAGPTAVAITDTEEKGKAVAAAMVDAFQAHGGLKAVSHVNRLDREGARLIDFH